MRIGKGLEAQKLQGLLNKVLNVKEQGDRAWDIGHLIGDFDIAIGLNLIILKFKIWDYMYILRSGRCSRIENENV